MGSHDNPSNPPGYSVTGKKMKKLTYTFSTFLAITSLGSFAASIVSFALLKDLPLGLVMVSFFPALVIYAISECCLGNKQVAEHEETNSQNGSDHHREPETAVVDAARSRAEQLEEMRRSREEGRARRAAYAAAGPAALSCSAPGCRWRTPQGVGDLATMLELMRLHTQQAHPVVGLPGGGVGAVSYQGGGGWGVPNYLGGGGGRAGSFQGGGGEVVNSYTSGGGCETVSHQDSPGGGMNSYPGGVEGGVVSYQGGGGEGMYRDTGRRQDQEPEEADKQPTAPPPPSYAQLCSHLI